jgi:hypothetical protein
MLDPTAQGKEPFVTARDILFHRQWRKTRIKGRDHGGFDIETREHIDRHTLK